ncbi:MAG: DUF1232 domain-containing protein [Candidatus Pacearchaeota archaeon]
MVKKIIKNIWIIPLLLSLFYLSNLGFGFIEFIPDNLPLIGNLDEGLFGALILYSLNKLNIIKK